MRLSGLELLGGDRSHAAGSHPATPKAHAVDFIALMMPMLIHDVKPATAVKALGSRPHAAQANDGEAVHDQPDTGDTPVHAAATSAPISNVGEALVSMPVPMLVPVPMPMAMAATQGDGVATPGTDHRASDGRPLAAGPTLTSAPATTMPPAPAPVPDPAFAPPVPEPTSTPAPMSMVAPMSTSAPAPSTLPPVDAHVAATAETAPRSVPVSALVDAPAPRSARPVPPRQPMEPPSAEQPRPLTPPVAELLLEATKPTTPGPAEIVDGRATADTPAVEHTGAADPRPLIDRATVTAMAAGLRNAALNRIAPADRLSIRSARPLVGARTGAVAVASGRASADARTAAIAAFDVASRPVRPVDTTHAIAFHRNIEPASRGAQPALSAVAVTTTPPGEDSVTGAVLQSRLVESMRMQIRDGGGHAELRLNPEFLGNLKVSIVVDHGAVRATLTAETAGALEHVQQHVAGLRDALNEQGLRLDELDLREEAPAGTRQDQNGQTDTREEHRRPHPHAAPPASRRRATGDGFAAVFDVVA